MNSEIDNIGAAIVKGVCNPEAKDLVVELGDLEFKSLLDEEVFKEVPIIKTVLACHKTWGAIHDRLFLRKVAMFLLNSPKFTTEEKSQFMEAHLHEAKKAKRLFDAIVLILDKLDDFDKPEMLAKIFAALVRNEFGLDIFRRLAAAIEIGFLDDLKELAKPSTVPGPGTRALYVSLLPTGLTRPHQSSGTVAITGVSYEVAPLGKTFIKCMNQ